MNSESWANKRIKFPQTELFRVEDKKFGTWPEGDENALCQRRRAGQACWRRGVSNAPPFLPDARAADTLSLGTSLLFVCLILLPLSALVMRLQMRRWAQYPWDVVTSPQVVAAYKVTLLAAFCNVDF